MHLRLNEPLTSHDEEPIDQMHHKEGLATGRTQEYASRQEGSQ